MSTQDFLLELGTEELPPKLLQQLSNALTNNLTEQLVWVETILWQGRILCYTKAFSSVT